MKKATMEALAELAKAAAKSQGWDENQPIEFTVCNTTEPNICDKHCSVCEGQTHHWMEDFFEESEDEISPERPFWACKHCDYFVFFGETETHTSGCDCPDCLLENDSDYPWCGDFDEK